MVEKKGRTQGREAQSDNINAAMVLADIVKTTLGPKGMDKMLVDQTGHTIITNDGFTILSEMDINHPAGKLIADISKIQEEEIGDGTTTAVMLAGKLLEKAEELIKKGIHPTTIIKGFQLSKNHALKELDNICVKEIDTDILKQIAKTAMTGKGAEGSRELLADLIVGAIERVQENGKVELGKIKIDKLTGSSIENSELVEGIVLDNMICHEGMPRKIENPKIALLDEGLEILDPDMETMVNIDNPDQLQSFRDADVSQIKEMIKKLIDSGANVILTQKGLDDLALSLLAKNGIIAMKRINKYHMDWLAKATGGKVVQNINELTKQDLGNAGRIREERNKNSARVYIEKCKDPKAVSILIHSSTKTVGDEIVRAMTDGIGDVISVFNSKKTVAGGGTTEIYLSTCLKKYARTLNGREQLAVEKFAESLEFIPETLAENAGLDPINVITELKQKHEEGNRFGLNLFTGKIEDTFVAGIIEPAKIKEQAITSATEVAIMILRIDDILIAKGSQKLPSNA